MSKNAITLIRRSGKGDIEAHRALAELAIAAGLQSTEHSENAFLLYFEASIYSRLAASAGLMPDRARLMAVLAVCAKLANDMGSTDVAAIYSAEGIALAELIADSNEGEASEFAAQVIINNCGDCSPEILEMAKEYKQLWGSE